ncbi:MAG: hypothetical protein QOI47_1173 [Actinomycetota bacterium]|nr:hypothetical protein [Actinomycetota bacterium]
MSLVVLLILAVVWGVFLVPQVLRARAERGPADSIGSFRNQLSMIEQSLPGRGGPRVSPMGVRRSQPYVPMAPMATAMGAGSAGVRPPSRSELQRRRRDVLLALLAAVIFTLALGLLLRPALLLNGVADLALVGYVGLLVRARTIAVEREMKVRYLPGPMPVGARSAEAALRSIAR